MNPTQVEQDGLMPFEEIGRQLGISKQAALKTYHRAMKKLRKLLRKNPALATLLYAKLYHENVEHVSLNSPKLPELPNRGVRIPDADLPEELA